MDTGNLLDCIAHNTSHAEFLASFNGDINAAVEHLRMFYLAELRDSTVEVELPDEGQLRQMMNDAKRILRAL